MLTDFISLSDTNVKSPVTVLRDTGAAQSFMHETELGTVRMPLHKVYLRTEDFLGFLSQELRSF